jgi:hypothetical protein
LTNEFSERADEMEGVMKRFIFAGGMVLSLAGAALGGPPGYTNSGTFSSTSPTFQIDATNVVNTGVMALGISSFDAGPFDFSDVLTYTNRGTMYCDNGFLFNDSPATTGTIQPSVNFFNQNPGQIYGGALVLQPGANISGTVAGPAPQIIISATNITSSGVLQVGQAGLISATGNALNLSHGAMIVEGFDQAGSGLITGGTDLGPGEFIQYWGGGIQSNNFFYSNLAVPGTASSPSSAVTLNDHTAGFESFSISGLTLANAIAVTNSLNASNFTTQVIIFADTGPDNSGTSLVNMSAHFLPPGTTPLSTNNFSTAVVKWGVSVTNVFGQVMSNTLYLTDDLGSLPTNVTFITNNTTLQGLTELVPTNYTISTAFNERNFLPGNTPYRQTLFTNGFGTNGTGFGEITNTYAAFSVDLAPVTVQPDSLVAGSTFSNVPARIAITANQSLDLTGSIINAGNYLNLASTNHYAGSQGAQITFPFADINLGSTNGQMTISNLVPAYLTRFNGPILAWSAVWTNLTMATNIVITSSSTNTNAFTVTNAFMVTMVLSELSPTSQASVENLSLRSTNVVISDAVTVNQSLLINAQNLTITTNAASDLTPAGQLIFDPPVANDFYSAFVPSMLNFTNYGLFETENAAFLQIRQNPNNPSAGDGPWQSVVNRGEIFTAGGNSIWANYFENTAPPVVNSSIAPSIEAEFGTITIQSSVALITNSPIAAIGTGGDMSITSGSLTIADEQLQATGFLNLAATNLLTDLVPAGTSAVTTGNAWSSGDGFSLLVAPTSLSGLLGTSITSACRTNAVCQNIWAGLSNTIPTTVGSPLPTMVNNVPIGQLILDGGNNISVFHFEGPNGDTVNPYAMYVDQIELTDGATNFANGKFTALNVDPNVTIFFLKASIGATDISLMLAGQAIGGGHLVWLNNNVGHFSATQVTYSDGQTFNVNSSYVQAYGLPPEPPVPLTAQNIQLQIGTTNVGSTPMAAISWYAQAGSTNTLYYRTLTNPSWLVRTNFVQGATAGRVTKYDSLDASHLYKVSVAQ